MARGRRRDEWDRTAQLMAWLARVMTGTKIEPAKLNPYRDEDGPAELTAQERKAAASRWIDGLMGNGKRRAKPEG